MSYKPHDLLHAELSEAFDDYMKLNYKELAREFSEDCGEPQDAICHIEAFEKGKDIDEIFEEFCQECFNESLQV